MFFSSFKYYVLFHTFTVWFLIFATLLFSHFIDLIMMKITLQCLALTDGWGWVVRHEQRIGGTRIWSHVWVTYDHMSRSHFLVTYDHILGYIWSHVHMSRSHLWSHVLVKDMITCPGRIYGHTLRSHLWSVLWVIFMIILFRPVVHLEQCSQRSQMPSLENLS